MRTQLLKTLFVDVTETDTVTQAQEESPSHEPIETADQDLEQYVEAIARVDGLTDAVRNGERSVPPP